MGCVCASVRECGSTVTGLRTGEIPCSTTAQKIEYSDDFRLHLCVQRSETWGFPGKKYVIDTLTIDI
jgi:hypothetical protein